MQKIKNFYWRIVNAISIGIYFFKNPSLTRTDILNPLVDLFKMILKVADENRPMITHIGFINVDTDEKVEIVSVWAGAGANAEPLKRIEELKKENDRLKLNMAELVRKQYQESVDKPEF
jgi:hypothetical protein